MISARSHLPLSSGNKILVFVLLLLHVYSCSGTKPLADNSKKGNVQIVKADRAAKKDTIPGKIKGKDLTPMDTIRWTDDDKTMPITTKEKKSPVITDKIDLKSEYQIKVLIPLNSDGMNVSQAATSRFVHFYAGMLVALDVLNNEGIRLNINVIDTEEGNFNMKDALDNIVDLKTDLIIGPFERDDVRWVAEKAKELQIPVVSPWQTSTKIAVANPYYIQVKPNLKEHFLKIAEHTTSQFHTNEVAIIGRNNKDYNAWLKYFQDAAVSKLGKSGEGFYHNYYVTNDSLNGGVSAFYRLLQNPKIKAVIIPNYSFNDEAFIYSCVRRLAVEKSNRHLILYGMPVMLESDRIEFDHYNSLNMRIVMSDFVDDTQSNVREFRRKFLDMFGEIALPDAVKAYDMMLYIGRNLWKYGKNFQFYLENERLTMLQTTYEFKKAFSDENAETEDLKKFDFLENKYLDIIEFNNSKFRRIN
ncbi:MAG: hypothetical protein IPM42_03215 [Saprospiraceae bacterium]|nr:hypothetical protein [Saprospiraceae bacterium]